MDSFIGGIELFYRCHCGEYTDDEEEICLKCSVNDSIENEGIDKYLEWEEVLGNISKDRLKKMNVNLKLQ